MKLNKESRMQLRANIEEQLKNVPDGERIKLGKELLEELLFETRVEELSSTELPDELDGKKVSVKYLVWNGPFLSKIDLSDVSFDDVFWNVRYNVLDYFVRGSGNVYREYGITSIDLSNTNAKIDFSKAFGSDLDGIDVGLGHCNFSNTDLSNNVIDYDFWAEKCNFSNTSLGVNLKSKSNIRFYSSILSGLDLSEYIVDETFFGEEYKQFSAINCDLSNTGLRVKTSNIPNDILSKRNMWLRLRRDLHSNKLSSSELAQVSSQMNKIFSEIYEYREALSGMEFLGKSIANGYLLGCYVNDKKITTEEEKHTLASEKLKEYEVYKKNLFNSVNSSIEEQVGRMKR